MRLKARVAKLEKVARDCPRCGMPGKNVVTVTRFRVKSPLDLDPSPDELIPEEDDYTPPPCPKCGRRPQAVELIEQIVIVKGNEL
jgi:hypothetical protein